MYEAERLTRTRGRVLQLWHGNASIQEFLVVGEADCEPRMLFFVLEGMNGQ